MLKIREFPKSGFAYYVKRPVVIRAIEVKEPYEVDTMEGTFRGSAGSFLIEGVKGELYVCARDIFAQTYRKVTARKASNGRT